MAIGILGAASNAAQPPTTVYTAPAGIQSAVVHVSMTSNGTGGGVSVNGVQVLSTPPVFSTATQAAVYNGSASVSLMLKPGDTITTLGASCVVSGYEVS